MMLRRVAACLAFVSSILLVAALPSTAAASDDDRAYRYGEYSLRLDPWEIPGGGDREGYGFARLTLDEDQERACYFIGWRELRGQVTAADLHFGSRGHNGPHAIDFFNNERFDGERDGSFGCVRVTNDRNVSAREKIRYIVDNPEDFYINVHTTKFESGAIRGQLR